VSLRRQLLVVALLLLSLPWAGCQFVREMEDALRAGQAQALRATGDSADIADQLLERFLAELPATGRRLQAAWEAGDWEDLWGLAHRVRGASAICATTALSAVVEELERHIRARERDPARRAIAAFRRQAKRLADGIADPRR